LVPKIKTILATLEPIHLMHFQLRVSERKVIKRKM